MQLDRLGAGERRARPALLGRVVEQAAGRRAGRRARRRGGSAPPPATQAAPALEAPERAQQDAQRGAARAPAPSGEKRCSVGSTSIRPRLTTRTISSRCGWSRTSVAMRPARGPGVAHARAPASRAARRGRRVSSSGLAADRLHARRQQRQPPAELGRVELGGERRVARVAARQAPATISSPALGIAHLQLQLGPALEQLPVRGAARGQRLDRGELGRAVAARHAPPARAASKRQLLGGRPARAGARAAARASSQSPARSASSSRLATISRARGCSAPARSKASGLRAATAR